MEDAKVLTPEQIDLVVKEAETAGKKIVFTNGCFDILHVGHVKYLEAARKMGDILIVGINSDASVTRLKGPDRPINTEEDRAFLVASLKSVTCSVVFAEDTPYEIIKRIRPTVLVKGGDYKSGDVVGGDIAKEVRIVDYIEGRSTTNIVKKIAGQK